jgi:hypothetical protein
VIIKGQNIIRAAAGQEKLTMASAMVFGDIAPLPTTTGAVDDKDQDQMDRVKALDQMIHNARSATEKEHKMTLMQGIKLYPKAIFWSLLISTTIVMEGYDVCLINNFCTCFEEFQHRCLAD